MACKDCEYFFRTEETIGRCQGKKYAPRVREDASCTRFTQSKHKHKLEMANRLETLRAKINEDVRLHPSHLYIMDDYIQALNYAISMLREEADKEGQ